ncbi:hypothetical protein HDE_11709 [Halotydeus destructor]|nr:hypothetical protein HDE_11709 [Halotydeus destructor]
MFKYFAFLIFLNCVLASKSWPGAAILESSLNKQMEDEAVFFSNKAIDDNLSWSQSAIQLREHFEDKFGGYWNCFVSDLESAHNSQLSLRTGGHIAFTLEDTYVVLWK